MKHAGIAVFIIFFGLSVLDAFHGAHWLRALFWIGIGVAFWALERRRGQTMGRPH